MWKDLPPLQSFGALQALDIPNPGKPTVVLFHGYGADAYDLAPLAQELGLKSQFRWLFPQGHKTVDIGGGFQGRAWFDIDLDRHERAARTGEDFSYANVRPPGVNEARDKALSLLKNLNVKTEDVILGGFSQGAMLAVELATLLPQAPRAVVILSGTLADRHGLAERAPRQKSLRFFQSHGEQDPLLPFSQAEALKSELEKAGWQSTWTSFPGGHEIPPPVLRELSRFLRTI